MKYYLAHGKCSVNVLLLKLIIIELMYKVDWERGKYMHRLIRGFYFSSPSERLRASFEG